MTRRHRPQNSDRQPAAAKQLKQRQGATRRASTLLALCFSMALDELEALAAELHLEESLVRALAARVLRVET